MKKQNKTPYTDELADQIIRDHNLRPEIKKVWKTRGHIPGAYTTGGIDQSKGLHDRDPAYQKSREILELPEISSTKFRTLGQKGADIKREKDRMTEAELIGFKTEVSEIRNKLASAIKLLTETNLRTALSDVRVKPTKIISNALYLRATEQGGRKPLSESDKATIKAAFNRLYNLLKI